MAKQLQLRGGTTAGHSTFTGAAREVTVDINKNTLVVHDGVHAGGFPLARESEVYTKTETIQNITSDVQVTVDTSGADYATINEALEYLSKTYNPTYRSNVNNFKAEILIKTGYVIAEQVIVSGIDLGWIVLSAEDSNVLVNRSAITIEPASAYGASGKFCFTAIKGGKFPLINNFTIDGQAVLGSGAPQDYVGGYFCGGSGSSITGVGTTGALQFPYGACWAFAGGTISAYNMTNSSDSNVACYAYNGGTISAGIMTNSSDTFYACYVYSGGMLSADEITNTSNSSHACYAIGGGTISAYAMINTSGTNVACYANAGTISAYNMTNSSDSSYACYAYNGGTISAGIMTNSSDTFYACYARSGTVSAAIITNTSNSSYACVARSGTIMADTLQLSNSPSSVSVLAYVIGGGIIRSVGGTWTDNGTGGKCNVAAGTISASGYVNRIG